MSTKNDWSAYVAAREAVRRLRRELHTIAGRSALDAQTVARLRRFSAGLEPHENDLTDLLNILSNFEETP